MQESDDESAEQAATMLLQMLLWDGGDAAAHLEREIQSGTHPQAMLARLDDVERLARTSAPGILPLIGALRSRIRRQARRSSDERPDAQPPS